MNNPPTTTPEPIPQDVIEGLAEVREGGETNMLDRRMVIKLVEFYGWRDAARWLRSNERRYMEALIAMGEWVRNAETRPE